MILWFQMCVKRNVSLESECKHSSDQIPASSSTRIHLPDSHVCGLLRGDDGGHLWGLGGHVPPLWRGGKHMVRESHVSGRGANVRGT